MHILNRMSVSIAQPQDTELHKSIPMLMYNTGTVHMHNTSTSRLAQHRYKYTCTTQVEVHIHDTGRITQSCITQFKVNYVQHSYKNCGSG